MGSKKEVWCWGYNNAGQVGNGSKTPDKVFAPTKTKSSLIDLVTVGVGDSHTCAARKDGLWCWGSNFYGQLGKPKVGGDPVELAPDMVDFNPSPVQYDAGSNHGCVRTSAGTVYCWGYNLHYNVGDGTTSTLKAKPTLVKNIKPAKQLTVGGNHACVIDMNDEAWCWGHNLLGQLGHGKPGQPKEPVKVANLKDVEHISAGRDYTCAVHSGGKVSCWGSNKDNQLATTQTTAAQKPWPIEEVEEAAAQVHCGSGHVCALLGSGEVMCWGRNDKGQCGHGTISDDTQPKLLKQP